VNFDSLLVRTLIYSGGNAFTLQCCRFASANGLIQPGSGITQQVKDATANAALQSLIAQFRAARGIAGNLKTLVINGSVNGSTVCASLRLLTDAGVTIIQDCYAEAAKDAVFGGILTEFIGAITAYNAQAKVI